MPDQRIGAQGVERGDVCSGAEHAARAGQDYGAHGVIGPQLGEVLVQGVEHRGVQCIPGLGSVDAQDRDGAASFAEDHVIVSVLAAHSSAPR